MVRAIGRMDHMFFGLYRRVVLEKKWGDGSRTYLDSSPWLIAYIIQCGQLRVKSVDIWDNNKAVKVYGRELPEDVSDVGAVDALSYALGFEGGWFYC